MGLYPERDWQGLCLNQVVVEGVGDYERKRVCAWLLDVRTVLPEVRSGCWSLSPIQDSSSLYGCVGWALCLLVCVPLTVCQLQGVPNWPAGLPCTCEIQQNIQCTL